MTAAAGVAYDFASMRRLRILVMLALVPLLRSAAPPAEPGDEIWMEIPDPAMKVQGNTAAELPAPALRYFTIHLERDQSKVDYGSIKSKINTESAGGVSDCKSVPNEIVCIFDLKRRAGFDLHPGRNAIEIEYKDPYERYHYASFLLQLGGKPTVMRAGAKAGPPERPGGEKYAVVVGVSHYQFSGPGLPNLQFADRDASAFRDFLMSPDGGNFPRDNIRFLLNEDATSQAVLSALRTFLTKPRPQDVVVIYFAGHGSPDPNDRRNLYLLTYDTKPDDMGGTAIPMTELPKILTEVVKAKRVVLIADSCHSFGIMGRRSGPANANNLINEYLSATSAQGQRAVMTASDVSEKSQEDPKWGGGHGVFTWYVLRGLKGEADANHDGTVTAGELFHYVHEEVQKATNSQQTPLASPGLAENLALSGAGMRAGTASGR
ncbi:MAG TPA: caspase family protein [Terriglobales bacterium]|nr:caspase family protein [Terriglobales bacterium]